jgi:hypothetical protein
MHKSVIISRIATVSGSLWEGSESSWRKISSGNTKAFCTIAYYTGWVFSNSKETIFSVSVLQNCNHMYITQFGHRCVKPDLSLKLERSLRHKYCTTITLCHSKFMPIFKQTWHSGSNIQK